MLFRRMRIIAADQLVEDIDIYNRIHDAMSFLIASERCWNKNSEAFRYNCEGDQHVELDYNLSIKLGQYYIVRFKPLSGLLNQNRMHPSRYAPITIELESRG